MGRTNPTFRDRLTAIEREWSDYRRALRRRDKPHFDRLFEHARSHADTCSYLNHDAPIAAVLLSIALEQERARAALEDRLAALDEELDALAAQVDGYERPRRREPAADQAPVTTDWAGGTHEGAGNETDAGDD